MKREALYFTRSKGGSVRCSLCPHNCSINEGKSGICGVRVNEGGTLYTLIYGEVTSISMDPIEKKPLYHFHPGRDILSIGTKGCNMKCSYCQNWSISQDISARSTCYEPDAVVAAALDRDSVGIAYTYSEPMIWFEYVLDCSRKARAAGLKNVYVTNGFICEEPLRELLPHADAMNIDLKSFSRETYRKVQKASLSEVLMTIEIAAGAGCHVELTTLVVTGMNDAMEEIDSIIEWIASVDRDMPWHISRYYPNYRYDMPATDVDFILRVHERAVKKLNYVFCGNISGSYGRSDTVCPSCGRTVIARKGYATRITGLSGRKCGNCGFELALVI